MQILSHFFCESGVLLFILDDCGIDFTFVLAYVKKKQYICTRFEKNEQNENV